ncbi:MAG: hypothetical protein COV76_04420 [Candidatus Omnitrophica bacterium CG11_big_fil_rev_8_21_14_0_20_64_10]|nr:MAG: hypothetical protein COV76_04420 [Candidatus Omnitrophica bacterium CG11_big_fil_rev_8_21_14_0_20_64_10]
MSWRADKKTTVGECKSISTTFLKKHGYFCGWQAGGMKWTNGQGEETGSISFQVSVQEWAGEIRFQYTQTQRHNDEKENLNYPVRLTAAPCRYGGKRWWFLCPLVTNGIACTRRVLKLYLGGGKYFGCRHCYNLTYESCQEHDARVDQLAKNPLLLQQMMKSGNLHSNLLAFKAAFKLRDFE